MRKIIPGLFGTMRNSFWTRPAATAGAPTSGLHFVGEEHVDVAGDRWFCLAEGIPGTWTRTFTYKRAPVLTTDDTPTVGVTINAAALGVYQVEAWFLAVRTNGDDGGSEKRLATFYNNGSTLVLLKQVTLYSATTPGASYTVSIDVNGTNIEIVVTGKDGHDVDWIIGYAEAGHTP